MAKVLWSVLCRKGIIDKYSNQVSIFDAIEAVEMTVHERPMEVPAPQVPSLIMGMMLVTLFRRTDLTIPERPTCRFQIIAPDKSKSTGNEVKLDLETSERTRYFAGISNLPPKGSGIYKFLIQEKTTAKSGRVQWKTIGETEMGATVKTAETSPT